MTCQYCNKNLRESQRRTKGGRKFKSCPECSGRNGDYHVYKPYPEGFGETPLRASAKDPHGAQSYCTTCRGGNIVDGTHLCSDF